MTYNELSEFVEKYNIDHDDPHVLEKYTRQFFAELDYKLDMEKAYNEGIKEGFEKAIIKHIHSGMPRTEIEEIVKLENIISIERFNEIMANETKCDI